MAGRPPGPLRGGEGRQGDGADGEAGTSGGTGQGTCDPWSSRPSAAGRDPSPAQVTSAPRPVLCLHTSVPLSSGRAGGRGQEQGQGRDRQVGPGLLAKPLARPWAGLAPFWPSIPVAPPEPRGGDASSRPALSPGAAWTRSKAAGGGGPAAGPGAQRRIALSLRPRSDLCPASPGAVRWGPLQVLGFTRDGVTALTFHLSVNTCAVVLAATRGLWGVGPPPAEKETRFPQTSGPLLPHMPSPCMHNTCTHTYTLTHRCTAHHSMRVHAHWYTRCTPPTRTQTHTVTRTHTTVHPHTPTHTCTITHGHTSMSTGIHTHACSPGHTAVPGAEDTPGRGPLPLVSGRAARTRSRPRDRSRGLTGTICSPFRSDCSSLGALFSSFYPKLK